MTARPQRPEAVPRSRLLPAAERQDPDDRSLLLEALTRLAHPSILVVAVYLLVVGLHHPGGGFAAGLVAGLGLVLRRLAGGPHELRAASPAPPGVLLGAGLTLVAGYAATGVVVAGELLAGAVWAFDAGVLGHVEIPSSVLFETGTALIIVGLTLDVVRTLGADEPAAEDAEEDV
ncbi:MnhB domain-containing protein [Blastococcus tunisiensis]|uniref:Multisubunit Na+/H+ antiporter, MnhB subunit n=1 Tax=Blastococcus tunisiensis TaxID=1798228 RepID=A0A1I2DUT7_9ACTN|nr:MnhB domain-containing protein [Blastococcus sp. DSM 46838]SFE84001.1 Multisubunit Na+/H+ antiporter, MnhB subunit [Blastococcus sp. DSM 46838]